MSGHVDQIASMQQNNPKYPTNLGIRQILFSILDSGLKLSDLGMETIIKWR